ncbi:hypothetical protein MIND_00415600 [Mycena indigotica]|uniref:Reverse transcriptase n=1 Tax=Mycena indigotica TaxID=2126181 RepID=A0A8H6SYH7_9AGAR|nr:uncharacterized protein MIND_00415600 [Mycena indigotica]KAF7306250.1 hypothetical protein MIND_00415600 [Mycena indigotica]
MVFGPISQNPRRRPAACLRLAGESVPWLSQHKYVGIWFDSTCRDIFRAHYEHKHDTAARVFWKTVMGCELYVGRGRLPADVSCQLYYALLDPHFTHGCDVMLDVDPQSFGRLERLNRSILRRILGLGRRSGIAQLYSELGIYPLEVRRAQLALRFLRYLLDLPASQLAYKALAESDCLRRKNKSSWMGDLALVLAQLPFPMPRLPSLARLSTTVVDSLLADLRHGAGRWIYNKVNTMVSLPLLHGRLEPLKDKPSRIIRICRRHYLSRVPHTNHRLALTRLLCGSFFFRGLHSHPERFAQETLLCRRCGEAPETPGHVFMQCRARETVELRVELREMLAARYGVRLGNTPTSRRAAEDLMRDLIFHWETVVPMARFIYGVCKTWSWFGRKLPSMASELAPESVDELERSDGENSVGEME